MVQLRDCWLLLQRHIPDNRPHVADRIVKCCINHTDRTNPKTACCWSCTVRKLECDRRDLTHLCHSRSYRIDQNHLECAGALAVAAVYTGVVWVPQGSY